MAIAVIFGLTVATVLTLFVVPCLYSLFFEDRKNAVANFAQVAPDSVPVQQPEAAPASAK
jgi:hypothetical protein